VREEGLAARFYFRRDAEPQLPIIFLGGSEGGVPNLDPKKKGIPFVEAGYCVLATAYFKEAGLPETLMGVPLEFYDKAKAWLAKHPKVDQSGIAIVGGSKGGELALLLASRDPEVKCVVGIAPASHVFQGIPGGDVLHWSKLAQSALEDCEKEPAGETAGGFELTSSWSYQGEELPYVPIEYSVDLLKAIVTYEFHDVYQRALENTEAAEKTRIPVENIRGAVLLVSGKNDRMWPATKMCDDMVETLRKAKFSFPYEHAVYDIGHSIGREQWKKIVEFMSEHYTKGRRARRMKEGQE